MFEVQFCKLFVWWWMLGDKQLKMSFWGWLVKNGFKENEFRGMSDGTINV